jgi:hypothetical protein
MKRELLILLALPGENAQNSPRDPHGILGECLGDALNDNGPQVQ